MSKRPLDTSDLGPIKLDTAPRVLRISEMLRPRASGSVVRAYNPGNFDVIEWQGVRFRKEVE
jgi:hypothetical protein